MESHPLVVRAAAAVLFVLTVATTGCADALPTAADPNVHNVIGTPLRTRTYFIAADTVDWNFAASQAINPISGAPYTPEEAIFAVPSPRHIGNVYKKALYREYTDATFTTLNPRPAEWVHLGALGPLVRGQVGDTLRIVFRNRTDRAFSVHPHGVFYEKDSEGAPYADDDGVTNGDAVPPNGEHVYTWVVPERAGPGPADGSSILWMYHSHVDEPKDANSGLIGPMIITRRGKARLDGRPQDVDREFVNMFMIYDENESWYLGDNMGRTDVVPAEDFEESNLKHAINGFLWANFPLVNGAQAMTMRRGERVRWYLLGMGTEVDLHTPHWHGQSLLWMGMRTDIIELLPASMKVADMVPDNPGLWLYHCHVNDHITAGMLALFRVLP
jgi:FtsP/CotA-like multicopper oxidase with cupredoxin domain